MNSSIKGGIWKVIATIAISVAVLYVASFLLGYYSKIYPQLIRYHYLSYIQDAIAAVIAVGLAIAVVRIIGHLINSYAEKTEGRRNLRGVFILVRIVIYAAVIFWFLSYIGINLAGALVGGAIGGIVIGFAVQSIASSILSGIMVTGGGFVKPGDAVSVYSWLFGQTITGKVEEVKLLHTRIRNSLGQTFLLPNGALFGSTIYTPLGIGRNLSFALTVIMPADIPADKLVEKVKSALQDASVKPTNFTTDIYLIAKNSGSNTFSVVIKFSEIEKLSSYQDLINTIFDREYWVIKDTPTISKK